MGHNIMVQQYNILKVSKRIESERNNAKHDPRRTVHTRSNTNAIKAITKEAVTQNSRINIARSIIGKRRGSTSSTDSDTSYEMPDGNMIEVPSTTPRSSRHSSRRSSTSSTNSRFVANPLRPTSTTPRTRAIET